MTGKRLRGIAHADSVERRRDMRVRLVREDVRDLVVPDAVHVALRFRGETAVEVVGDRIDVRDADIVRKQVVDALPETARLDRER